MSKTFAVYFLLLRLYSGNSKHSHAYHKEFGESLDRGCREWALYKLAGNGKEGFPPGYGLKWIRFRQIRQCPLICA